MIRASCFNFEAAHNYFKVLARKQNFKNLEMSLAKRIQLLDACHFGDAKNRPSSHPLFDNERKFGVMQKLNAEESDTLRTSFDNFGLLPDLAFRNVYHVSWVVIRGTRYRKQDIVLIDSVRNLPIFGKIDTICFIYDYIYFNVTVLQTIGFDKRKQSYKVNATTGNTTIVPSDNLVDYNTYQQKQLNCHFFIPTKYCIKFILSEHAKGVNPLNL